MSLQLIQPVYVNQELSLPPLNAEAYVILAEGWKAIPVMDINILNTLAKLITGEDIVKKLFKGPSYIATHLHHVKAISTETNEDNPLMTDFLTIKEKMALVGFIPGSKYKCSSTLLPIDYLLNKYLDGFIGEWNKDAEAVMEDCWSLIEKDKAWLLTKEEWSIYLIKFLAKGKKTMYHYSKNNEAYGINLFTMAYLSSWEVIPLHNITIPEEYYLYSAM
ncbi:hypothetical protein ARMGADRAFT_1089035 [Armillaria gallica]|uniref:Uncharacterized protein n=1 Tax=Armillaria gallica TaxID=47427 RepID=A0A2H3CL36_ARMGA|nr:hypothetical protein ARMGADRAFT_1089035 [Armillaria gallica]